MNFLPEKSEFLQGCLESDYRDSEEFFARWLYQGALTSPGFFEQLEHLDAVSSTRGFSFLLAAEVGQFLDMDRLDLQQLQAKLEANTQFPLQKAWTFFPERLAERLEEFRFLEEDGEPVCVAKKQAT